MTSLKEGAEVSSKLLQESNLLRRLMLFLAPEDVDVQKLGNPFVGSLSLGIQILNAVFWTKLTVL